jgi:hypothetical protein
VNIKIFNFNITIILLISFGQQYSHAAPSCYNEIIHDLTTYKTEKSFNDGALDGYNQLMQIEVEKSLGIHAANFNRALKEGDSHAKHLNEMGFRFSAKSEIKAPELNEVVSYYDKEMMKHVVNGELMKDDILKMSRIFFKGEGKARKLVAIPLGDEVPKGFLPFEGSVDSKSFYKFIADKKFIIGENIQLNSNQSFFMHDLSHFTSFIDNPKYMKALVDYSKDLTDFNRHLVATNKASAPPLRFEVLETLASIKPKHVEEVKRLLKIPDHLKGKKFVRVEDLKTNLSKLSTSEINTEIEALINKFPFFIDYIGGSSRDIAIRSSASSKVMGEYGFFARTLLQRNHELKSVAKDQKIIDHFLGGFKGLRKSAKVEELAKFKSYVHGIMNVSPEKWLMSLRGDELIKNSPVQEFFRSSGLDQYDEYQLYNLHNKEELKKSNRHKRLLIKSMLIVGGYITLDKLRLQEPVDKE